MEIDLQFSYLFSTNCELPSLVTKATAKKAVLPANQCQRWQIELSY